MELEAIGVIHTPFATKEQCPIQPVFATGCRGTVTLYDRFAEGLKDVELFSHIYLLYLFDRAREVQLIRLPFLDDTPHGIFASRHPCRPNGIGMSIVRLEGRSGNVLNVEGIDVLDGTPLIDIKPYVPRFDCFGGASEGWVADKEWRPKPAGRE